MTIASIVLQVVQQFQFIGMLSAIDINWPQEWFDFTSLTNFVNLSFENFIGNPKLPTFDRRLIFIMVSICIPLFINVLLLIIFQPIYVVVWYLCLCAGAVLLCAGLAGEFLSGSGVDSASTMDPMTFIIIGAILAGGALFVFLLVKLAQYCGDEQDESMKYTEEQRWLRRFHRRRALKHFFAFIVLAVLALLCTRIVIITIPRTSAHTVFDNPIILAIGFLLLILAAFALVYMVVNWCAAGRRLTQKCAEFSHRNILLVLLAFVSMSYIPTISYAIGTFMCRTYTCPAGSAFNPYAQRPPESYDTSESRFCDPCAFNTSTTPVCGLNVSAAHSWCPAFSERRSWRNPDVSCDDEATVYFYISAAMVLIVYMIGIPVIFYRVISYLTINVVTHARIGAVSAEEDIDDVWTRQMSAIQPVAASLYDPFRLSRRYYTLVQLVHRLLVTFTITVLAAFSNTAVVFVLVFHGAACVLLALAKPFVTFGEQIFAIALAVCNVLNSLYAIVVWQESSVPSYTAYIFLVLNGLLPAIGAVAGTIIARRYRYKKALEAEQRLAVEQMKELEEQRAATAAGHANLAAAPSANATGDGQVPPLGFVPAHNEHRVTYDEMNAASVRRTEPADDELSEESWEWEDGEDEALDEEMAKRVKRIERIRDRSNLLQRAVMDEHSTGTLNKAFMAMGVFFILALGIAVLGLLRAPEQPFLVASTPDYSDRATVFAGYTTWDNFVGHCCCMPQQTPSPDFNAAERWVCANGKVVERGRVLKNDVDDGRLIRSVCSTSFNDGCSVSANSADEQVVLTCPSGSAALEDTTQYARDYLF